MDLSFEIQLFIENRQKASNNLCGTPITTLISEFGVSYNELKPILTNLYREKKIITRKGLNQVLIFLPKTK